MINYFKNILEFKSVGKTFLKHKSGEKYGFNNEAVTYHFVVDSECVERTQ